MNNCIIVINKFINYNEYLINDLHIFYEFIQKYNIQYEYIGTNGYFSLNPQDGLNNNTSVEISYNLDLLKQGNGILLDRSVPNEVTVKNSNQTFNVGDNLGKGTLTQSGLNELVLIDFSNYFKHVNNGNPLTLTGDLTIRLKDSLVNWKTGQRYRISFGDEVYPGVFNINILTNSLGKYPLANPTNVGYSTNIITLDDAIFASQDYLPVFDIVCIDEKTLKFQVDLVGKSLTNNV
jgi:hypothetical protein